MAYTLTEEGRVAILKGQAKRWKRVKAEAKAADKKVKDRQAARAAKKTTPKKKKAR